mmetsp:Transcript_2286/g.4730  ORF Transcript_2286/g.4730 Transcript_2286/m.4730 type:complete len:366 (-) Transcript_2286:15-1112(-)
MLSSFRLINVMSLFAIRYFADAPFYNCVAGRIGSQFLIFILLDLTVNNLCELAFALLGNLRVAAGLVVQSHEQNPMELTDDYLEVIYRQFVLMASFSIFPPICFLSLFTNSVEYLWDRFRFLRIVSKPKGAFNGGLLMVAALMGAFAFMGLIFFPTGPIWYSPLNGPVLCWPCSTFSQETSTLTTGVCGPGFEPAGCADAAGAAIGQDVIAGYIGQMASAAGPSDPPYIAAKKWFDANTHLFHSRRCSCRPCAVALSCGCSAPPPQRLDAPAPANALEVAALSVPRSAFSFAGYQASNKSLAAYCGGHPINAKCWECPEVVTNFLYDPMQMLSKWPRLSFCDYCTGLGWGSPCLCHKQCPFSYTG